MNYSKEQVSALMDEAWKQKRWAESAARCEIPRDGAFFMCNFDLHTALRAQMTPDLIGVHLDCTADHVVIRMFGYRVVVVRDREVNLSNGFLFVQVPLG